MATTSKEAAKLLLMIEATQAARRTGTDLQTVQAAVTRYTAHATIERIVAMIERVQRCEKSNSVPCC